jgi:radical SAM protein with 4Fe4S-binding SPASM domain
MGDHTHFSSEFIVVYLRVVQGCNLNCAHCFTLGNRDEFRLVDLNHVRQFLRAIVQNVSPKKAVVYIHGGETFLAPREHLAAVNEIVREEFASLNHYDIIPQTNLMYEVDDEYIAFIKREYNSQIGVSWDYKIRFNTAEKNLDEGLFFNNFAKLTAGGLDVAVAITVQKHLLRAEAAEWLPKFDGAKSLDFEFLTLFDTKTRNLKVNNDEWSEYLFKVVQYYVKESPTWSMPQIDLFTKSFVENRIFSCKGNCCLNRTFTLNCNGSVGLCPDQAYVAPISDIGEVAESWESFELKGRESFLRQMVQPIHELCSTCEFYDHCGGNCEPDLFDATSKECPLSRKTLRFQKENLSLFINKLHLAKTNLVELRDVNREVRPACH